MRWYNISAYQLVRTKSGKRYSWWKLILCMTYSLVYITSISHFPFIHKIHCKKYLKSVANMASLLQINKTILNNKLNLCICFSTCISTNFSTNSKNHNLRYRPDKTIFPISKPSLYQPVEIHSNRCRLKRKWKQNIWVCRSAGWSFNYRQRWPRAGKLFLSNERSEPSSVSLLKQ